MDMSNCKTKKEAKKEVMGLTFFCMDRTQASCRHVEGYNMAARDVEM